MWMPNPIRREMRGIGLWRGVFAPVPVEPDVGVPRFVQNKNVVRRVVVASEKALPPSRGLRVVRQPCAVHIHGFPRVGGDIVRDELPRGLLRVPLDA